MEEYSLKDDPEFYKKIFESAYDAISVLDHNLNYIAVNPAFLRLTRFSAEEILGKNLIDLKGTSVQAPQVLRTKTPVDGIGVSFMVRKKHEEDSEDDFFTINKNYTYTSIAPIINGDEAVGTVACFKLLEDVRKKLEDYTRSIKQMKNQITTLHKANYTFQDIIGDSKPLRNTMALAQKMALSDANILLLGESGTGKDVFAQAIHNASPRARCSFVALNCACLPESLAESELFGYEEGAFSGAVKGGKTGLYEIADCGTLFLDEIGDLDLSTQTKILRVIENGQFMQVGGRKLIESNVRIISATNKNLEKSIAGNLFREDLYYRINTVPIEIPPLRRRKSDIPLLAWHFLHEFAGGAKRFDPQVLELLQNYSWPGNIRELRNTIMAMVYITDSSVLRPAHLPEKLRTNAQPSQEDKISSQSSVETVADAPSLAEMERRLIAAKIDHYGCSAQSKKLIAKEMGISLSSLYNKIRYYDLNIPGPSRIHR